MSVNGFSYENSGELLISPVAHEDSMKKTGLIPDRVVNVGGFAESQSHPLRLDRGEDRGEVSKFVPRSEFCVPALLHRPNVFLKRRVNA